MGSFPWVAPPTIPGTPAAVYTIGRGRMGSVVVMEEVVEVEGVLEVVKSDMGVLVVVKRVRVCGCCGVAVEVKSVRGWGCLVVVVKRLRGWLSGWGGLVVDVKSVIGCGCVDVAVVVVGVKSGGGWGCVGVEWRVCWGCWCWGDCCCCCCCWHIRKESPSTMNTTFSPPPSLMLSSLSLKTSCKTRVGNEQW